MAKFVQRVTVVDLSGQREPTTVYKASRTKRKVSRWLKPLDRIDGRVAKAAKAFGTELVERRKRSGSKRRNGFLRDANVNVFKAHRKALKKMVKR